MTNAAPQKNSDSSPAAELSHTSLRERTLMMQLEALRASSRIAHQELLDHNAQLIDEITALRQEQTREAKLANDAHTRTRDELTFFQTKSDIDTKIGNHLVNFYIQESVDRMSQMRNIIADVLPQLADAVSIDASAVQKLHDITSLPTSLSDVLALKEVRPHGDLLMARTDAEAKARALNARISVIMPTYNRATTLVRALQSALEQSLTPHEVIVADDKSTDNTISLLNKTFPNEIAQNRLVILPCEKGGVCKTRNAALKRAAGDVIAYLDSDNFWHPDHLLWGAAALTTSNTTSAYTAAQLHHLTEHWSRTDSTPYDRKQLLKQNFIDMNCFIHKASLYHKHGGFDLSLSRLVDWEYILRLTTENAALRVPVPTVEYFLDKSGLGNISFDAPLQENAIKVQLRHRAEMRRYGILSANAEKRLDTALAKMNTEQPSTASSEKPASAPIVPQTSSKNHTEKQLYFGGINLFVVLPNKITPPKDLPVSFVTPRWITYDENKYWREYRPDGSLRELADGLPHGNYWCPDLRQGMPTSHQLATLTAAVQLTTIDFAVGSFSLDAAPSIATTCFRNQIVMRRDMVPAFLAGQLPAQEMVGKVLRIPQGPQPDARKQDLATLLGRVPKFAKDGQTFSFASAPDLAKMRQVKQLRKHAQTTSRPRVLIMAQKLAVGGVERNTIEIARQLQDDHECVYLTMEKIHPEQGSLCHQAVDACSQVLDLAEIGHHAIYLPLLRHITNIYAPDNLWICNGSMWLAANSLKVRDIFARCGIVDQQVYDVDAGWIQHYQGEGVQSFDRFIAINRKIQHKFIESFQMDPTRIDLIYSAINAPRFRKARTNSLDRDTQRRAFNLPLDKKLIVFMGRLVEQKRPLDFLEMARLSQHHTDQHFVLVGNGILATRVEEWFETYKPTNITWIRNVADTTEFWPAVDVYIVTSEYEGLPIALIEAISLGVPVVATDVGDIRYVLDKFKAGHVVDNIGDPESFTTTLQTVLPNLSTTAEKLETCGDDIINFFSAETISKQFVSSFANARTHMTKESL